MLLIEMPLYNNFRYILRVIDHLSQYGFVAPLTQRSSLEVGQALMNILSSAIMPNILQSDNGGEVGDDFFLVLISVHRLSLTKTACYFTVPRVLY